MRRNIYCRLSTTRILRHVFRILLGPFFEGGRGVREYQSSISDSLGAFSGLGVRTIDVVKNFLIIALVDGSCAATHTFSAISILELPLFKIKIGVTYGSQTSARVLLFVSCCALVTPTFPNKIAQLCVSTKSQTHFFKN